MVSSKNENVVLIILYKSPLKCYNDSRRLENWQFSEKSPHSFHRSRKAYNNNICTDFGASAQDMRHLFACNAYPTDLSAEDLWWFPWDQFVRLATSTTGTLTDLTTDMVVANNNRSIGSSHSGTQLSPLDICLGYHPAP